jgi:methionyl-tRNA synthetase
MSKKFYITTTIPYVNAEPHIGFALEIIQADVIARTHRLSGEEVVFNFGTDEHGQKIYQKALEAQQDPKEYCDEYSLKFDELKKALNLSYTNFIRTTDEHHIKAAQEFWRRCKQNGDIYKKNYRIKYCVGCELEKTDSELTEGRCPLHPNRELEIRKEENYFFRFSKYQNPLLGFYKEHPDFVIPEGKYSEIKAFVEAGLEDFSVSRLKSKMPWGITVPDDPEHVMYVWFDALINYISTLGWPENEKNFRNFWPGLQVAGKDNLRQQSAMWQAMLMSAGLPNSTQIFIHGFMTVDGQKISKSLGNVIDPIEITKKYGADALRYYLLAKVHPWEDSDFTKSKFNEVYNADLANGLGNLVARVAKLAEKAGLTLKDNDSKKLRENVQIKVDSFRFDEALKIIWGEIARADQLIDKRQPWTLEGVSLAKALEEPAEIIRNVTEGIEAFLPETAEKIMKQFGEGKISSAEALFPRIREE